jgi:3-hydroxymyristoyl/3-hydroxydecanoyl-(acyl carrier protein) dehydratase
VHSNPGVSVVGIKHVTQDDFYLTVDEQGNACFIPSLIGETLGQLAAWNVMQHNEFTLRPVAGVVARAQLHRPAYVGETLLLASHIHSLDERAVLYSSEARVGDELVFSIENALGPLLPMEKFINAEEIRNQFAAIYQPDDWLETAAINSKLVSDLNLNSIVKAMTFDRILTCEAGVSLVAEKKISSAEPYFPDHFPYKPVLPMTVLLECKLNLAQEFISRAGFLSTFRVCELRKIKMNDFVQPGDVVICHVTLKNYSDEELTLNFRSEVNGKRVCVVDVVLTAKGE